MRHNITPEETAESLKIVKILQRTFKELTRYIKTSPQTAEDYKILADLWVTESQGFLTFDDFLSNHYQDYCVALGNLNHHDVALTTRQAAIDYYSQNQSDFLQTKDFKEFCEAKEKTEAFVFQYLHNFNAAKEKFAGLINRNPQYSGLRLDYAISLAMGNEVELAIEQLKKAKQLFGFDIERKTHEIEDIQKQLAIATRASDPEKTKVDILTTTLKKLRFLVVQDKAVVESLPKLEKHFQNPDYIKHLIRQFGKKPRQELQNPAAGKKFANEGMQACTKGKYEEAINFFDKALEETNAPKDAIEIYFNAGCAYENLQNFPSACTSFRRAFSLSITAYQDLLKLSMKVAPKLDQKEELIIKMVTLQITDESCKILNIKDRENTLEILCAHLRQWCYEPLAKRLTEGYALEIKIADAITQAAKYFLSFSKMLRYVGNFTTPVELSSRIIDGFKDETDQNDPETIKILHQLEKDAEMAAKIIPIIESNQKQLDDKSLAILREYLRYEPDNPVVNSFCKLRSITLPPNLVKSVLNELGDFTAAASSSTISFVIRNLANYFTISSMLSTLQEKGQKEDSSSTPLQDLTPTAPEVTPLGSLTPTTP